MQCSWCCWKIWLLVIRQSNGYLSFTLFCFVTVNEFPMLKANVIKFVIVFRKEVISIIIPIIFIFMIPFIIIIIHASYSHAKSKKAKLWKWKFSNRRRYGKNWLEGESRGEQVGIQLFYEGNRCACFDSARPGIPNCEASYPEATRTKTAACRVISLWALGEHRVCVGLSEDR